MRFPDLPLTLERGWPLVLVALMALMAFAQARGLSQIVAAELTTDVASPRPAARAPATPTSPPDATPILKRNVFDSTTGPLTGEPAPVPPPALPPSEPTPTMASEACDFGVVTTIVAGAPDYAFASITTRSGKGRIYGVGDAVDDRTLGSIGWDRVWLEGGAGSCHMKLGDTTARPNAKPRPKRPARRSRRSRANTVPAEIANKISRVSADEYTIERSAFEEVLERQAELMRQTRVRPVRENGEVVGLRVVARPGTLLHAIGIRSGDVVKSINGFDLTNPQKALEAYGRLKTANRLSLSFERNGKTQTIDYRIL